ncbi:conserved hypothetical protein [Gammaproteobacteria bacterium]
MGGFLLIRNGISEHSYTESRVQNAMGIFARKKLQLNKKITLDDFTLYVYFKRSHLIENVYYFSQDDFVVSVGTFFYNGKTGHDAQLDLRNDILSGLPNITLNLKKFAGHFCILAYLDGRMIIFNDSSGTYHVYCNTAKTIFSSSFIALTSLLPHKTCSKQEIYEYIFYGTTYGDKTVFKEVELLNHSRIYLLSSPDLVIKKSGFHSESQAIGDFGKLVIRIADGLMDYFDPMLSHYRDNISLGLSGGFDSRLLLAIMRAQGVCPRIYTHGEASSSDFRIAKLIAESEGLTFTGFGNGRARRLDEEGYARHVEENYFNLDGLLFSGYFDYPLNMDILNSQESLLNLNGGGGEIYRNFWKLPDKPLRISRFISSKFESVDFEICTDRFSRQVFFEEFQQKIAVLFGKAGDVLLSGREIHQLYPFLRLHYWTGRGASILNQYSNALLPFCDARVFCESFGIPLNYKSAGRFEAALIARIHPSVAAYPSNYGHDFLGGVKISNRLLDEIKIYTPISLRPSLRRLISRRASFLPYFFDKNYIDLIFGNKEFHMMEYVDIYDIKDAEMLSRVLSIEYLLIYNK